MVDDEELDEEQQTLLDSIRAKRAQREEAARAEENQGPKVTGSRLHTLLSRNLTPREIVEELRKLIPESQRECERKVMEAVGGHTYRDVIAVITKLLFGLGLDLRVSMEINPADTEARLRGYADLMASPEALQDLLTSGASTLSATLDAKGVEGPGGVFMSLASALVHLQCCMTDLDSSDAFMGSTALANVEKLPEILIEKLD